MRVLEFECGSDCFDVKYILKNILGLSSSLITKLKNSNGIYLNDESVTVRSLTQYGDVLRIYIPHIDNKSVESVDLPINILYEDEDVICINKPPGMPVHPSANHYTDTLANRALAYLRKKEDEFHIVTRLDRYTSGIILAAKNQFSASKMCTDKYHKKIVKKYLGVCRGIFQNKSATIEQPIDRCSDSIIKRCISPDGKYAKTTYNILTEKGNKSLVEFILYTGRTHQIRVHTAYIGHPLENDFLYDSKYNNDKAYKLHCCHIEFVHPYTGETIHVDSKIPINFI